MKDEHISFESISSLYDGECGADERDSLLAHINTCPMCGELYEKFKKTMGFLTKMKIQDFELKGFVRGTMRVIRENRRRRTYRRAMIAAAASLFIVAGVGLMSTGVLRKSTTIPVAQKAQASMVAETEAGSDSQAVIDIIRKHNANIVKVSNYYIEGEVPRARFTDLRRELGFRKVSYTLGPKASESPLPQQTWRSNLEEVGLGTETVTGDDRNVKETGSNVEYVRFRVYR